MPLKNYLIAPLESGLQNNIEPWLIPEDAFQFLENAYVWRGRVRKRFGTEFIGTTHLHSRLRINLGNTDGAGAFSITVPGTVFAIGQSFSVGTEIFTVNTSIAPFNMLSTGAGSGTFNTTSGVVNITGAALNTAVYFYPSTPVMGLRLRETSNVNFEDTVGFDTQFAYTRLAGAWERLGTAIWTGTNSDFYWTTNYRGTNPYETFFYVVNGIVADNIKYLPQGSTTWTNLRPQLNSGATRFLETCGVLVGFKDRLIALNTIEDESGADRTYINRARWCQNGDPTNPTNSWLDDTPGRGGYVDAGIEESIVTAEFIKDRLIVYFERSTWELVYTGDTTLPFRWQQLNNELGAESKFSIIGFDKAAVGVGNVGIHTCNGVNVSRIDQKIPDEVFKIHNGNNGPKRVYGIRDYYRELVYWTFPDFSENPTFPTNILVWNYQNNTWAFFKDSFTCLGYYQDNDDTTWESTINTWQEYNQSWIGAEGQSQFPFIVGGNQEGFTFIINANISNNTESLYITDMNTPLQQITIISHNLQSGDFLKIEGAQGITLNQDSGGNDITIFKVTRIDDDTISIDNTTTTTENFFSWTGTYTGGGTLARVSNLNITSKQWNPGTPIGQQFRIPYIDFLLDRTENGEVSVDYFIDSTSGSSLQDQIDNEVLLGSNILYTQVEDNQLYQSNQVRIWHRYFLQTQGMMIQIKIFMSDSQMRNENVSQSGFQLNGIIIYVEPEGRIVG